MQQTQSRQSVVKKANSPLVVLLSDLVLSLTKLSCLSYFSKEPL
nr:MAG TPA: hypothetical protein [Caudoviricetes sp.]